MKIAEASKLKKGDLVIITKNKIYQGLVFEIESIRTDKPWCYRVTLKQPYFDTEFRIFDYDSRGLERWV